MSALGPAGSLAVSAAPDYAMPADILADERAEFVYVAEIYPYNLAAGAGEEAIAAFPIAGDPIADDAGSVGLFFATQEWATAPTDYPANQPFDGRLREPLSFVRSLLGSSRFGSLARGRGSLSIDNADGAYDAYVTGYALAGRRVVVRVGRVTDAYADFVTLFDGTARDWRFNIAGIEIELRDAGFKLDVPAQPNSYAGTGGIEGGDDLAGKRRPLALGFVEHAELTLVDPANLIYQVHDGAIATDLAILDQGVALTYGTNDQASYAALEAYSVAAGEFELWPAGGFVKLGSLPAGVVTFQSAEGDGLALTGAIVRDLIAATTLLDPQELVASSFAALDAAQAADVGIFIAPSDNADAGEIIEDLLAGIGAFGAFDRHGRFFVDRIVEPAGSPVDVFDGTDIVELDRDPLPAGLAPPPWRTRVAYKRNYQVLDGELAAAVAAADRAYFAEHYLLGIGSDPAVLTAFPLAQDSEPVEAFFAAAADAEAEAARLQVLYGTLRSLWRLTLPRRALLLELGDLISIKHPRFGLSAGRSVLVLEVAPEINAGGRADLVEVVAYG